MPVRATLISSGRVQGVGYRMFVEMVANRMGIGGTVRNLSDGTVETVAYADSPASLHEFMAEIGERAKGKSLGIFVDDVRLILQREIGEKERVLFFEITS